MRLVPSTPRLISPRASADRWLFGYADIVTLLLACFASLYAAQALPAASAAAPRSATSAGPVAEAPHSAAEPSDLAQALTPLAQLSVDLPGFDVTTTGRGVTLSFAEAGSFPTGQADLTPAARHVLRAVADQLRDRSNQIRVEGHTDDAPIRTPAFASNWELSTARATEVVRFLIAEGRLPPARLSAAGYAEFRPRLPNTSAASRARNRRVDLVVLDPADAALEPAAPVTALSSIQPDGVRR